MSCAILGHEREASEKIFQIVKRAFTYLPETLKPQVKTDTIRAFHFTHRFDGEYLDSSIYVALKLRAGTVQKLHITESAFNKDRVELIAGSKQTVPITGSISEETTANGFNEFYDDYMRAYEVKEPGPLDYKCYFYPWFIHDEYQLSDIPITEYTKDEIKLKQEHNVTDKQLAWRRWKRDELSRAQLGIGLSGEQLFKQEYPSSLLEAFQSGAGQVFSVEKLEAIGKTMETTHFAHPDIEALHTRGFKIWEQPIANQEYLIGIDPSDGEGADFSCIDIWTRDSLRQVAQYYGKVLPDQLAQLAAMAGNCYNEAFIGVENNMLSTILFLSKIYSNYYFETRQDEKTLKRTKKLGWNTNVKTRDLMIDEFLVLFEEGSLTIRSSITISEMRTFVKKDTGKREHADGKHDDALFAGMIAVMMRKFKRPQAVAYYDVQKPF